MTPIRSTTAAELLVALERGECSPVSSPDKLRFAVCDGTLSEFIPYLTVLHTGVRAVLMNVPWLGLSTETGWATSLNPNEPIPRWVGLLAVMGDTRWDRIRPAARFDLPGLFADVPEPKPSERLPRPKRARAVA